MKTRKKTGVLAEFSQPEQIVITPQPKKSGLTSEIPKWRTPVHRLKVAGCLNSWKFEFRHTRLWERLKTRFDMGENNSAQPVR
jgi:hypothetical protein